jgi:hypothetical protein
VHEKRAQARRNALKDNRDLGCQIRVIEDNPGASFSAAFERAMGPRDNTPVAPPPAATRSWLRSPKSNISPTKIPLHKHIERRDIFPEHLVNDHIPQRQKWGVEGSLEKKMWMAVVNRRVEAYRHST